MDIQLLMDDGSTRGPVNLTGTAMTNYTLEALVASEGSLASEFKECVGAWIKVNGSTTYWNLGLDKSLTNVGGAASTSMLTYWEPGVVYALGKSVGANSSALEGILADIAAAFNTADNRIMVQQRGTAINLTADGTAYSGPCVLRRVVVNTGTAGACIVYDNTAASGTIIGTIAGANPGVFEYGSTCSNGVYINLTAGQDVTVVVEPI